MRSLLADHFKRCRKARRLSLGQLAALLGYRSITKGMNRVKWFEDGGKVHPDLLIKLVQVLEVDPATVNQLIEEDRRQFLDAWNRWADEPIQPCVVVRLIPAICQHREIPAEVKTLDQMEQFASEIARNEHKRACLVVSRRLTIWFNEKGQLIGRTSAEPNAANMPYSQIGNKRFLLGARGPVVLRDPPISPATEWRSTPARDEREAKNAKQAPRPTGVSDWDGR